MATHYLYGTILTGEAVAANNRGDNIGNTTTLQKVFHQDRIHTSVSAEAIRFAIRYRFQLEDPDLVNRTYNPGLKPEINYKDDKISYWSDNTSNSNPSDRYPSPSNPYIDDDLMGFMDAAAAAKEKEEQLGDEGEEQAASKGKQSRSKTKKAKGKVTKRQSPLAIGRAVSLRPYRGELSFNCTSGEKKKGELSLYSAEMHTTEYQYSFGLNLGDVVKKAYIGQLIEAIIDPPQVAGNHARFAYDFSPASIVLRFTSAHSSRIQNCFEHDEESWSYTIERLVQRVEAKDIPASELILGGEVSLTEEGDRLAELGATVLPGVYAAAEEARQRIALLGDEYGIVAGGEA